ncbi:MAG: hypothetical protein ABFS56_04960 [Pseudomonadota bacterium]
MAYLRINFSIPEDTQSISKEKFYAVVGNKAPKKQVLSVALRYFEFNKAVERNISFKKLLEFFELS